GVSTSMSTVPKGSGKGRFEMSPTLALPPDRLPPQNIEAEQGVLGGVLLDNEMLHEVIPLLKVEDFYRDSHQVIYRAIRDLYDQGKPVDAILLAEELTRREEFEKVGGPEAIAQIANSVPHAANAKFHAQVVHEKAVVRQLIEASNEILRDGYANTYKADDLL